jgi:hypothetical protein
MIEITRQLASQFRTVMRKAMPFGSPRNTKTTLALHADGGGLRLRAFMPDVALELHVSGARTSEVVLLPGEALADFESKAKTTVTLESVDDSSVEARWDDGGVPQVRSYTSPDPEKVPPFPEMPSKMVALPAKFLKVLDDATSIASHDRMRYAVNRILLRGSKGDVAATDGRQLLLQGDFSFPWEEDLLVPAMNAFSCKELPQDVPVSVGKSDTLVCVRVGPWTFFLSVDKDGRFPSVDEVLPREGKIRTTCSLSAEDAEFLTQALPRLPVGDDSQSVTIDLNGHVAVRGRAEGQSQTVQVCLDRSEVSGASVQVMTSRKYLARALELGFRTIQVAQADVPVACREGSRTYGWMPLGEGKPLPEGSDVLTIHSAGGEKTSSNHEPVNRTKTVNRQETSERAARPVQRNNADAGERADNARDRLDPIAEAQALKDVLRDAHGRATRLVAALKHQRKQSKLVATTLASLRQLNGMQG